MLSAVGNLRKHTNNIDEVDISRVKPESQKWQGVLVNRVFVL